MDEKSTYAKCQPETAPRVAEPAEKHPPVIPFVSRAKAEKVFSSQRSMSLEEGWKQVDRSLGRLSDSE